MEEKKEEQKEIKSEEKDLIQIKEEEIKNLTEQVKLLVEKVSSLEKNMMKKTDLKINVKTLSGKDISVYVDKSDKISKLKTLIKEKENIPENSQHLILNLSQLDDNKTILESDIKETSTIYLMKETGDEFLNFCSFNEKVYFVKSIENNLHKKFKNLLYDARRDGDDAKKFHLLCDDHPFLLYVIKTIQDIVFAVYVSKPITSENVSKTDSIQMVISPKNNFAIKSKTNKATYHCNENQGAHFHCMEIRTPFLSTDCVDIQSCSDFDLPCYPSGNSSYRIKELQVFALEDIKN